MPLSMRVVEKSDFTSELYLVPGVITYAPESRVLEFKPSKPLKPHTKYRIYLYGAAFQYVDPHVTVRSRKKAATATKPTALVRVARTDGDAVDDEDAASEGGSDVEGKPGPTKAEPRSDSLLSMMSAGVDLGDQVFDVETGASVCMCVRFVRVMMGAGVWKGASVCV